MIYSKLNADTEISSNTKRLGVIADVEYQSNTERLLIDTEISINTEILSIDTEILSINRYGDTVV